MCVVPSPDRHSDTRDSSTIGDYCSECCLWCITCASLLCRLMGEGSVVAAVMAAVVVVAVIVIAVTNQLYTLPVKKN